MEQLKEIIGRIAVKHAELVERSLDQCFKQMKKSRKNTY